MESECSIDIIGTHRWFTANGMFHREGDKPAIVYKNGTRMWLARDKMHRNDDKPAIIWADGSHEWFTYSKSHRGNDKPAVIDSNGFQEWWIYGDLRQKRRVTNFYANSLRCQFVTVLCSSQ